jgi:hypothetical protein
MGKELMENLGTETGHNTFANNECKTTLALFSNIIMVNCNLNHKALGSSDQIHGIFFPKEICNKGKAVLAGPSLATQVSKVDFFVEGARSWIEKGKQVPSGHKILDGCMVLIGRREIPLYHDGKKHNFSRLRRNMSFHSECKT